MSLASADAVERSVHKTNEWLNDIRDELGQDDREEAWRILNADLQVLRDQLTMSDSTDAERALGAATNVLSSHITPGEWDDLIAQLPSDLRSVLH